MDYQEIFYPAHFAVGAGSINAVADFMARENKERAFIVTDTFLGSSEMMKKIMAVVGSAGGSAVLYDKVQPNPSEAMVDDGVQAFTASRCDFILAVGGGSSIDLAKGVSVTAANGGSVAAYVGFHRSVRPGVPVVAVATTAGTGSEATKAFVLTDHENHTKAVSLDDHVLVALAVSDPELMLSLPREITASTGLDALTHAVEAYCAVNHNPFSDGLALQSIQLIDGSLLKVLAAPEDIKARTDMCWAASLAGYAFSNSGLGLIHSIGFSIENFVSIPHGQAVGLILPYVLEFNRREIPQRVTAIGAACGIDDRLTAGARTVQYLYRLQRDAGMPTLRQAGLAVGDIPALAEMALKDPTLAANPVQPDLEEVIEILESAYCEDYTAPTASANG